MQLVDAHCHFDFPEFDDCRDDELAKARASGLVGLVIPGVRRSDWSRVRDTALAFPEGAYCLGIHPWYVGEHDAGDLELLEQLASDHPERFVAIGECGLDRLRGALAEQWPWFEAQVGLAARLDLPLVIHSVRTHDEVHGALRRLNWNGPALIHGFSGSYQQAAKLVALGCSIGVGGVITHGRARKTRDAVARLPLEALVLETDAPDMSPQGVGAGRNSPANLRQILSVLAELRGMSEQALAPILLDNVAALYRWRPGDVPVT